MLDKKGFDLWANNYDISVGLSDDDGSYPFAGYKQVLNIIFNYILESSTQTVLDIGFGTGTLTKKLYDRGYKIYGQDFSDKMLEIAREKMPSGLFYLGDFSQGLAEELKVRSYDSIVATYSLHHLQDQQKIRFMKELISLLNPGGQLLIGDVAFLNRQELERCRIACGEEWDTDEYYFVADELMNHFPTLHFEAMSHCAGVLRILIEE